MLFLDVSAQTDYVILIFYYYALFVYFSLLSYISCQSCSDEIKIINITNDTAAFSKLWMIAGDGDSNKITFKRPIDGININ